MKNTTNESQQQNAHVQEFLQTVLEKMGCGGCDGCCDGCGGACRCARR